MVRAALIIFLFLAAVVAASEAQEVERIKYRTVEFKPCRVDSRRVKPRPTRVLVNGCEFRNDDSSDVCEVSKGDIIRIKVEFNNRRPRRTVKASFKGKVGFFGFMSMPGADTDACDDNNLKCGPLAKGEHTYKGKVQIAKYFPKISTTIQAELADGRGRSITCYEFPLAIV